MMIVRIRTYRGDGAAVGEIEIPVELTQRWLAKQDDPGSEDLRDIRDLVDPDHENENYDWDIWARPGEVSEDLGDMAP